MWLSKKLARAGIRPAEARVAEVTDASSDRVTLQGASEHREVPVLAPYGLSYLPPAGEKAVLLPLEQGQVCVGFPMNGKDLAEGELLLRSAGGAAMRLKSNGDLLLNGLTIKKAGEGNA